jgi:hypothetical protein
MKKVLASIVALVLLGLGYTQKDGVEAKFTCADKVARQYTTNQVVPGAYGCVDPNVRYALSVLFNVNNAADFAQAIGNPNDTETFLGKTKDGGYTYRYDMPVLAHSETGAVYDDIKAGNFGAIWPELNGNTQGWSSQVVTYYLYPSGSKVTLIQGGKSVDVSGEIELIK